MTNGYDRIEIYALFSSVSRQYDLLPMPTKNGPFQVMEHLLQSDAIGGIWR